jgi:hypothetical protein
VQYNCPPAAAFAALTGSSKLEHLDIQGCSLPAGAWEHMFPTGRQMPQLESLFLSGVVQPSGERAAVPEISRLVSICPGLQSLTIRGLQCSAEQLAPLTGLRSLHTLQLTVPQGSPEAVIGYMCQLTGLEKLDMQNVQGADDGLLLQLTQLRQLTSLDYCNRRMGFSCWVGHKGLCVGFTLDKWARHTMCSSSAVAVSVS